MKNERIDYYIYNKLDYSRKQQQKIDSYLSIFVPLISLVGVIFFIELYINHPEHRNLIIFSAALFLGWAVFIMSFFITRHIFLWKNYQKTKRTFDLIERLFMTDVFGSLTVISTNKEVKEKLELNPMELIKNNPDTAGQINLIMNNFENISIEIKLGYVDEAIMHEMLFVLIVDTYRRFYNYIAEIRMYRNDPTIMSNLQILVESWEQRGRYISTGKKIIK